MSAVTPFFLAAARAASAAAFAALEVANAAAASLEA